MSWSMGIPFIWCHWHQTGHHPDCSWLLPLFPFLQCTVTCGGGVQTRSVHCVQQGRPSSSCLLRQKPPVLRACNTNFCPAPEKRGKGPHVPVSFTALWNIFQKPTIFDCAAYALHNSRGRHSHQSLCEEHSWEVYKAQIQEASCSKWSCLHGYARTLNSTINGFLAINFYFERTKW